MTVKKLIKKLILFLSLRSLSDNDFVVKVKNMIKLAIDNALVIPDLTPTPAAVKTKVDKISDYIVDRQNLIDQQKTLTEKIQNLISEVNDNLVDEWMPYVQTTIAGNTELAKTLGYGIKGQTEIDPLPLTCVPVVTGIDVNVTGHHILTVICGMDKRTALPKGILRIDVYGQTGGERPDDLVHLIKAGGGYLGQVTKGKFDYELPIDKKGSYEYYILVYVSKKTKKPFSQSIVYSESISL
jgi:hypothetical protein